MTKTIGHYRASTDETAKLIAEKRKIVLSGPVDFKAGHEMTKKTCLVCHTLHAEGATVGPDLTGSGRSTLDALLTNVLDPNQIIGKGYEQVNVTTQDDQILSGRLVEDTADHVKLLSAGPKEDVIAKSDIKSMKVSELSVMPEGLGALPDADFRNLIWYVLTPEQTKEGQTTAEALAKKYASLVKSSPSSQSALSGAEGSSSSKSAIKESWSRNGNLNGSILDGKPETLRVTYDGKKVDEDWYALEFPTARTIARVLFSHGKNFHDGGWFDTSAGKPKLQIKNAADAAWKTIATLENYPTTNATNPPDLKDGQRFEFKLAEHVSAVAIRILGKPSSGDNPTQAFSSCAELQTLGE
jgi:putative heme-binding domain-containing protein